MSAGQRSRANARSILAVMLKRGKVHKAPCEECGSPKVEAHREDYSKPLQVRWLCRVHRLALRGLVARVAAILLLAVGLQAQTFDVGSPEESVCTGRTWKPGTPGYEPLGSAPWQALKYDPEFTCKVPTPAGFYIVTLGLMEPNKTAAGQRLFTVTANGLQLMQPLDLVKLAGTKKRYTLALPVIADDFGITLTFKATIGNAVLSALTVEPLQLPLTSIHAPKPTVPMVPIISVMDGALIPADFWNATVTVQVEGQPRGTIYFGFPSMQYGDSLRFNAGRWLFTKGRPNPATGAAVFRNGVRVPFEFSWIDPKQLPDAVIVPGSQPDDTITADYVTAGAQ